MKKYTKSRTYVVMILCFGVLILTLYYGGYYYAVNYLKSDNLVRKSDQIDIYANTKDEEIVTKRTRYIEEAYDIDTEEIRKSESDIPIEYIGYNREQLIDYLARFMSNNEDRTLKNIQLISFSDDAVVIRKTVCTPSKIYKYFVVSEENIIKIYDVDKKVIIIDTGIDIENLDEECRKNLEKGFYLETIHELYSYLESVTT